MAEIVAAARVAKGVAETTRIVLRPPSADGGDDFTVAATDAGGWQVRGTKPERWVRQTDFSNDEAVGFLADRLNRLGVEARLLQLGAEEGDTVLIGDPNNAVVFDFKPGIDAGAENLAPPRRGHAVDGEAAGRRSSPRHPGGAWPTAPRVRSAPTSPAGSTAARPGREMPTGPTSYEIGSGPGSGRR